MTDVGKGTTRTDAFEDFLRDRIATKRVCEKRCFVAIGEFEEERMQDYMCSQAFEFMEIADELDRVLTRYLIERSEEESEDERE